MKNVVIVGSAKLQDNIKIWKNYFLSKGYNVINSPKTIPLENFDNLYPDIHKAFFKSIENTDILFIMNEDKNNINGYIGAEAFAELAYGVVQKLIHNKSIEIILRKMPNKNVQSYDEIMLYLKLGWIKIFNENDF